MGYTPSELVSEFYNTMRFLEFKSNKLRGISYSNIYLIKSGAFTYCSKLLSVSFPNCSYIGNIAFWNCSALTTALFPKCSFIGGSAFAGCINLISISFPKCSFIDQYAFYQCSKLSSIELPNCSYIGGSAFAYCSSLTNIRIGTTKSTSSQTCAIGNASIFYYTSITTIELPKAWNKSAILLSTGWYLFQNKIVWY